MKRVRIKFCGITRVEDARAAVALGVDAIGLVMTQKSRRYAGLERARDVRQSLPPFVSAVALFMDDEPGWIAEAVNALQPDLLQFHGNESASECARFGCPYLKALAMGGGVDVHAALAAHPRALGFLLDGHAPATAGRSVLDGYARRAGVGLRDQAGEPVTAHCLTDRGVRRDQVRRVAVDDLLHLLDLRHPLRVVGRHVLLLVELVVLLVAVERVR